MVKRFLEKYSSNIAQLRSSKLVDNFFWNSVARFGSAAISFFISLFLMEVLSVEDYGEYVVYFSIYTTIPFVLDLGLNGSFVSMGAAIYKEDLSGYRAFESSFLVIKLWLVLGGAAVVFGLLALGLVSQQVALVVVLGTALGVWEGIISSFKARQNFRTLSLLVPLRNILALSGVIAVYFWSETPSWMPMLSVIMFAPLVLTLWSYFRWFRNSSWIVRRDLLVEAIRFGKWIGLFSVVTAVHSKTDVFMLKYFSSTGVIADIEVGYFSAAFSMLAMTNVVTSTFAEAALPKVSSESNSEYFRKFMSRIRRTMPFVFSLVTLLGILIYAVLTYGFGGKFADSADCLFFIGTGMVFQFYIHSLSTLFYPLRRTDMLFWTIMVMFAVNLIGGVILIPLLGALGAAITYALVSLGGLVFSYFRLITLLAAR